MLFPASAAGSTIALQGQKLTQDVSKSRFGISYLPEPENRPIEQIKPLSAKKEAILDLADKYAVKHGLTPDRSNLRRLLMAESGIDKNAVNPSSHACGLFQRLKCPWGIIGTEKPFIVQSTIEEQLDNGMAYIKNRYGSIAAANDFQLRNNWY